MLMAITRLRLCRAGQLPVFLWHVWRTRRQLRRQPGCLDFKLRAERVNGRHVFWTATLWEDEHHMIAFRNAGDHRAVMPKLATWCDEASYTHSATHQSPLPGWSTLAEHLQQTGRLTPVRFPSPGQLAGWPLGEPPVA